MEKHLEVTNDNDFFSATFFSDEKESEITRAFRTGDDKFIQDYAKQFESKKDSELFYILDSITVKRDRNFDVRTVNYNKYIIEEMLSRNHNCLHAVMVLNCIGTGLSNQQHYDYLVRNIPVGRKNYRDGSKIYLAENAKETIVKILLMYYYKCNFKLAQDYLDVLKARNKVLEFVWETKGYLISSDANNDAGKYIKNKDHRKEYDKLVDELIGGNFDRDHFKNWW